MPVQLSGREFLVCIPTKKGIQDILVDQNRTAAFSNDKINRLWAFRRRAFPQVKTGGGSWERGLSPTILGRLRVFEFGFGCGAQENMGSITGEYDSSLVCNFDGIEVLVGPKNSVAHRLFFVQGIDQYFSFPILLDSNREVNRRVLFALSGG